MLGHYILRLRRERKGWSGGYTNPQGGGGNIMAYAGANRFSVIASGLRMITPGSTFEVLQDGRAIAKGTKRGSCAHSGEERGCFFCLQAEARRALHQVLDEARMGGDSRLGWQIAQVVEA